MTPDPQKAVPAAGRKERRPQHCVPGWVSQPLIPQRLKTAPPCPALPESDIRFAPRLIPPALLEQKVLGVEGKRPGVGPARCRRTWSGPSSARGVSLPQVSLPLPPLQTEPGSNPNVRKCQP